MGVELCGHNFIPTPRIPVGQGFAGRGRRFARLRKRPCQTPGMKTGRPGNPKLSDPVWVGVLERYVRGEPAPALAAEHGVSVSALHWQARNRGYRKMDRPDAVYRWAHPPPLPHEETRGARFGVKLDWGDIDGAVDQVMAQAVKAAARGRTLDVGRLMRLVRDLQRLGAVAQRSREARQRETERESGGRRRR